MNAFSIAPYSYGNGGLARNAAQTSTPSAGLGPNQLTWLRRNIDSFKQAEEQRYLLWQDAERAARIAGLI
jgi:hypothetical protein